MKRTTNKRKTTTVSCDESTRQFIAAEAERTGLLQREVLADMVKVYKRSATKCKSQIPESPGNFDLSVIEKRITKDVNRVIGFIQEQEKIYLKQILEQAKRNGLLIQKQIDSLNDLDF